MKITQEYLNGRIDKTHGIFIKWDILYSSKNEPQQYVAKQTHTPWKHNVEKWPDITE